MHNCVCLFLCCSFLLGHFGSLNMEFEIRKENISITIMPLGLVYTERVLKMPTVSTESIWGIEPGITPAVSEPTLFIICIQT